MLDHALSALVLLFVTIGPLETAFIFAGLTAGAPREVRRRIAVRAVTVATVVLAVFAVGGAGLLALLGIGMPAFRLAGGLLLLLAAVDLMFAHPTGLTSITTAEAREAEGRDIAVFPLAIPLMAGPGAITAMVLLVGEAPSSVANSVVVLAALLAVMGVTYVVLALADRVTGFFGLTGVNVVARVSGIVLAALAMQLMLDGLRQSGLFGAAPA
jgi:multiple antibiotic resistance protein